MLGLGQLVDVEPLRQHREFRLLFAGQLVNNIGTMVTQVALPYQLYVLTHSALALAALATSQLLAHVIFSIAGGPIADAMDRRRLLFRTQLGLLSVSGALTLLALTERTAPWELYVLAFLAGIFQAVERPARQAMVPRLVAPERLTSAIALNMASMQTARAAGPALGGAIIAWAGVAAAYALDTFSFAAGLAALVAISAMPPAEGVSRPSWQALAEGVRYVVKSPVLLSGFAVDLNAMVFGFPGGLMPVLALDFFHVGPIGLGLMMAFRSGGAMLGALFSGWCRRVRYQGRVVIAAVAVWGAAITLFGLTTIFPLALALLLLGGAADNISAILRNTIVQLSTPDALRGRVSALNSMVTGSGPRLGDLESTSVAAFTNAQVSVVSGGVLCLLGLLVVVRLLPQLMAYDAQAAVREQPVLTKT
jgi:MFS family permease